MGGWGYIFQITFPSLTHLLSPSFLFSSPLHFTGQPRHRPPGSSTMDLSWPPQVISPTEGPTWLFLGTQMPSTHFHLTFSVLFPPSLQSPALQAALFPQINSFLNSHIRQSQVKPPRCHCENRRKTNANAKTHFSSSYKA